MDVLLLWRKTPWCHKENTDETSDDSEKFVTESPTSWKSSNLDPGWLGRDMVSEDLFASRCNASPVREKASHCHTLRGPPA